MLGMFQTFIPKFAKKYGNVAEVEKKVFKEYINDFKRGKFPKDEHVYHIKDSKKSFEKLFNEFT